MTDLRNIMKSAWQIARKGAAQFGGSARQYFAAALRQAWAANAAKRIVRWLDRAAERACQMGRRGATRKQTWFLASIIAPRGIWCGETEYTYTSSNAMLTSAECSALIDSLK